ncbi:anthranilate phosphoribosyltransferase [Candidatus Methanomassiliicoccus intestinalis]|uniref:anthranilate phosphoribosyltransferase n=1 Tax=Candidatus Methanomassiliicoccus intestinalis TaxID=1406512 RepID=UPI0037DD5F79
MEDKLRFFGKNIDSLIKGNNLSRADAREMFRQILMNEQPDLQQGAFLAAITAKGATPQEIAGGWETIFDLDTVKISPRLNVPIVENCGTGMDAFKTFNISTAASIIAAADGVPMARHGARAITSKCGTIDLLESVGIDVDCEANIVKKSIETANIGIFNGMSSKIHPCALGRILSQIRFGTILNIAASLANPASPTIGVRGVYDEKMILPTLETMQEIGFKKALVFHGKSSKDGIGMDEISISGKTLVAELKTDGSIHEYTIDPRELGISCKDEKDLQATNIANESIRFLRLLEGEESADRENIACLNAAAVLYISDHAADLQEGLEKARSLVASGKSLAKLKEWVTVQNSEPPLGLAKFDALMCFC